MIISLEFTFCLVKLLKNKITLCSFFFSFSPCRRNAYTSFLKLRRISIRSFINTLNFESFDWVYLYYSGYKKVAFFQRFCRISRCSKMDNYTDFPRAVRGHQRPQMNIKVKKKSMKTVLLLCFFELILRRIWLCKCTQLNYTSNVNRIVKWNTVSSKWNIMISELTKEILTLKSWCFWHVFISYFLYLRLQ